MYLASLTVHHLRLPMLGVWETSAGSTQHVDTLVVCAETDYGHAVWTESCPLGDASYLPETAATAMVVIRDLIAPRVLRQRLTTRQVSTLLDGIRGWSFAKAAVESLYHLHDAQDAGIPLWQHLGGRDQPVACGAAFGRQSSIDSLVQRIAGAVDRQVPRVKLKIMPGWDVEPVRAVRDAFPDLDLTVDANGAYGLEDVAVFRELDACGLLFIEQPLHYRDLVDHAALQTELQTPICLDESVTCEADAERALRHRAARVICLKPGRLGGIGPTIAIHDRCRDAGIGCWVGGMLESGIGTAVSLALAALPNCRYPADLHPCGHFHRPGILRSPIVEDSPYHLAPLSGPGLGVEPNLDFIREHSVQSLELPTH